MEPSIKETILTNPFSLELLQYRINEQAFRNLHDALNVISQLWRNERLVDKDIVLYLYETSLIMRNKLSEFQAANQLGDVGILERMLTELDRLILEECLRT